MAADLESEETCSSNEERVCGSQWPNAPISIVTSSDNIIIPLVFKSLKACWYISLLPFLNLALWRQSGELYGTVSSIRMISLALTMTKSGRAEVSRISAGMVVGGVSVALISGKSAYSLSPGWRHFLRPSANISNALSCRQVYLPCERDTGHPFNICWTVGHGLSHRGHLASGLSLHRR